MKRGYAAEALYFKDAFGLFWLHNEVVVEPKNK